MTGKKAGETEVKVALETEAEEHAEEPHGKGKRKGWKAMSAGQKGGLIVLRLVGFVLTALALWDLKNRPDSRINGQRRAWMFAAFAQPIGPLIYFIFGRKNAPAQLTA